MSGLFVELYLDEDVDVLVAEMLRAYGFVATTTREAGHLGASAAAQLAHAASVGKVFVTHNRVDVERLAVEYFSSGREHPDAERSPLRWPGGPEGHVRCSGRSGPPGTVSTPPD
jgi:hypothetical protein